MTSKLPINLENLLRQRQVEGERIEYKAGWNPDDFLYANGVSPFSPGLQSSDRYPGTPSPHAFQPQRGCVLCDVRRTQPDGTALRFDVFITDTQGRPHCIRPTLGWRTKSRWDRNEANGHIQLVTGVSLDELDLTEGRSTGISKIIKAMAANGSPAPEMPRLPHSTRYLQLASAGCAGRLSPFTQTTAPNQRLTTRTIAYSHATIRTFTLNRDIPHGRTLPV
jgi:hypothetical protein